MRGEGREGGRKRGGRGRERGKRRREDRTNGRRERGEGVTELKAIWINISLGLAVRCVAYQYT